MPNDDRAKLEARNRDTVAEQQPRPSTAVVVWHVRLPSMKDFENLI